MDTESEMKAKKAIRTIALTPKGERAISDRPKLTWEDVLNGAVRGRPNGVGRPKTTG
jgi:hypothetical protein